MGPQARRLRECIVAFHLDSPHPWLHEIRTLIEQNQVDEFLAADLLLQIQPLIEHSRDHPQPLHRPPFEHELYPCHKPDLTIASLLHRPDVRYGLRLRDRPRDVLVTGSRGSGKTTLILASVEELIELGRRDPSRFVAIVILDKKLDYAHLKAKYGDVFIRLSILDIATRISLAAPPGVPANAWINIVATLFAALAGMISAWTCFASMMRWALAQLNPRPGETLIWPSLKLLLDIALAAPLDTWAPKADYEKTAINALLAITEAMPAMDCANGLQIERDVVQARKHLILEMPDVKPAWVRQFIIFLLIGQCLYGRIHRHTKVDRANLCFVLDESDQDATDAVDERFADKMSPLSETLRWGREYGIMTILGLGSLQAAGRYVLSEPQYQFVFSQADPFSVSVARRMLQLPHTAEPMFAALEPGVCVARETQAPWPHPVLLKCDYRQPGRSLPSCGYDTHPIIPAKRLDELPALQAALAERTAEQRTISNRQKHRLSNQARRLLNLIALNPWAPAATLWRLSGSVPSRTVQQSVRDELVGKKYAEVEEPRIGSACVMLYRLTAHGCELLGHSQPRLGRGSITHQHICHWIGKCAEIEGHKSRYELVLNGHATDCAVEIAPAVVDVFEVVVTATDNILSHLERLSEAADVRSITIVTLQKREAEQLRQSLASQPAVLALADRLRWDVANTFLRRCYP